MSGVLQMILQGSLRLPPYCLLRPHSMPRIVFCPFSLSLLVPSISCHSALGKRRKRLGSKMRFVTKLAQAQKRQPCHTSLPVYRFTGLPHLISCHFLLPRSSFQRFYGPLFGVEGCQSRNGDLHLDIPITRILLGFSPMSVSDHFLDCMCSAS